jgi:hypothetical protein
MARQLYVDQTRKGPTEILDHTVNWVDILDPIEDTIADAVVEVDGDMTISTAQFTEYDTTAWLSGGTAGKRYVAAHTITTTSGRKFRRSVRVLCVQR